MQTKLGSSAVWVLQRVAERSLCGLAPSCHAAGCACWRWADSAATGISFQLLFSHSGLCLNSCSAEGTSSGQMEKR